MKLGFVGTGALSSAIVTGLKATGDDATPVVLSPRNEELSSALAARFADVSVAPDNQAVLDQCDTIMLAVRPQIAREVLSELTFRPGHHVISLIATLSLDDVASLVSPVARVVKALPMPMIAERLGATIIYPPDSVVAGIFGRLGRSIEVDNAAAFDALSVVTATYATYFKYLDTINGWLKGQGIPDAQARDYVATLYHALAHAPLAAPTADFMHLSQEYATRGGINEQVLRELTEGKVFDSFTGSLDAVHRRIIGA